MSPRPKRSRRIGFHPIIRGLKPIGVPFKKDDFISLHYEEFEAIRLADYENLPQVEAAKRMNISRPTFTRIYDSARKKMARSLIEGQGVSILGGDVYFDKIWYRCNSCNQVFEVEKGEVQFCIECKSEDIENINQSLSEWQQHKQDCVDHSIELNKYCLCVDCYYKKNGQGKCGNPSCS
ncbi:MAG: hypothetical protein C0594_07850 [Marinilabiliales bacterium]|nr:MAG: hypothetical protein C0594_07850 [Marinilabiliales bacterium]